MKHLVLAILITLTATQAHAGRVYFNAAGAESRHSDLASCASVPRNAEGGATDRETYTSRVCDGTVDEGWVWHFYWQPDMPTTGTVTVKCEHTRLTTGTGSAACHLVELLCSLDNDAAYTHGAEANFSSAINDMTVDAIWTENSYTPGVPTSVNANDYCALHVVRNADGATPTCTDDYSADVATRGCWIEY